MKFSSIVRHLKAIEPEPPPTTGLWPRNGSLIAAGHDYI